MYCVFIVCYFPTLTLLWNLTVCQGQLHWTITVTKAINCQMEGLKWLLENVATRYQYPRTYIDVSYRVIEDIKKLNKIYLHIERCNIQGYNCEDFQNWKIDNFCQMITWKKQIWSEFVETIQPPFRCPVKKAIYEARNASLDVNSFLKWYPDMEKYHWKAQSKILGDNNDVIYCGVVEANFHQSKKQDRKLPRRTRYNSSGDTQ